MESLIPAAYKEGIERVEVCALVHINDALLLVEREEKERAVYDFIHSDILEGESFTQALQRAVMQETGDNIQQIEGYLGHQDYEREGKRVRRFLFTVILEDPYEIWPGEHIAYAWKNYKEAVGYPITESVRGSIDLFGKWRESSS